jgi:4-hydroxybenzoate polyprenyltransferase
MRTLSAIVRSMRPRQWTKNLLVFAPLLFAGRIFDTTSLGRSSAAFALFCLVSGAVYLFNDVRDVDSDRLHGKKSRRPIASGELTTAAAIVAAVVAGAVGLTAAVALGRDFLLVMLAYVVVQMCYTLLLRRYPIVDVMTIAAGFVLRAVGGTFAIRVPISPWLLACTGLLALFLALGKRRHELLLLEGQANGHRTSLGGYSREFIDQMMASVTAATMVSYALYTFLPGATLRHERLMLTVPLVIYGLFRYLYLVYLRNLGGDPEEILLSDKPLIADILLFVVIAVFALYVP